MDLLSLGVMARSLKENERRLPLHPHARRPHPRRPARAGIFLETGYGERHGVSDDQLERFVGGFRSREQLVARVRRHPAPKPLLSDIAGPAGGAGALGLAALRAGRASSTQVAIDRQLTLIAFEAMNHWNRDGSFNLHVFHKNNELAGYCSVLHALQIAGITGDYGPQRRAVVIGFGATARGAVTALNALGVGEVDVLTHRQTRGRRRRRSTRPGSCTSTPTTRRRGSATRSPSDGPVAAGGVPRRARHRRQLRAPGHRRPAHLHDRATTSAG